MELEDPWTTAVVNGVVQIATDRGHGERIVVGTYMLAELLANMVLSAEELRELLWDGMESREVDLSLQTAHAKLGVKSRRHR
jgi:hypothetical protein